MSESRPPAGAIYRRLLGFLRGRRLVFGAALFAVSLDAAGQALFIYLLRPLIDETLVASAPQFDLTLPALVLLAVVLRVIEALRDLPPEYHPTEFYGCEVWRDLDWLPDKLKCTLDVSPHPNLTAALVGVFDSQICGGKRYDLATVGRRRANATYFESHQTDFTEALTFAMDLLPILQDKTRPPEAHVCDLIEAFAAEVRERAGRLSRP